MAKVLDWLRGERDSDRRTNIRQGGLGPTTPLDEALRSFLDDETIATALNEIVKG